MRTTVTLDDDIAVRLERLGAERGDSFKSVLNDVLRRGLQSLDRASGDRPRYRIQPHHSGRCYLSKLDSAGDALAFAEGEAHR